jgi:hypothetical protein
MSKISLRGFHHDNDDGGQIRHTGDLAEHTGLLFRSAAYSRYYDNVPLGIFQTDNRKLVKNKQVVVSFDTTRTA